MKKQKQSGPDLFGSSDVSPTTPKAKKADTGPTAKSIGERNLEIAGTCGDIAGMPASFARALEGLRDIMRRSDKIKGTAGILTQRQAQSVASVAEKIEECWRVIDGIIKEGVAIPKKAVLSDDLF